MIQNRTLKRSNATRRRRVSNFNGKTLCVHMIGLCIIRGIIKGRNEPLCSFSNSNHGRPIFGKQRHFVDILRYIRFDDNAREQEDKNMTNMPLLETCGKQ